MSNSEMVHCDDWGVLYRKKMDGRIQYAIKVSNSTPEVDGSFKDYFLDVGDPVNYYGVRPLEQQLLLCFEILRQKD